MMLYNVRAIRLVLTNLILFSLTWYYQVPQREWSLITVWFVMFDYAYVGGVQIKSIYRFLGTMLSSLYGLIIIYFFYNNVFVNILAFIPAIFIYVYFFMNTEKAYIGTIGCVTLSIVLLNHNDIDAAILRTFNVFLGILASLFMMRFFYPEYARDNLMDIQAQCVINFETIFNALHDTSLPPDVLKSIQQMNQQTLIKTLSDFKVRLDEAKIETLECPEFVVHHQKSRAIIDHMSQLLSTLMHYNSLDEIRDTPYFQRSIKEILKQLDCLKRILKKEDWSMSFYAQISSYENAQDQKLIPYILDTIQQGMNEWRDEMTQIVSLYQVYVKPKPIWIKRIMKRGHQWFV